MIVKELMSENPMTAQATAKVGEVVEMLLEVPFRHLPILEGRTLVGIVSDRDLRGLIHPRLPDARAIDDIKARWSSPITSLMSGDPISVNPETEVGEAVDLMLENAVGALPVVDASSGDLLGILSYVDVLRGVREVMDE